MDPYRLAKTLGTVQVILLTVFGEFSEYENHLVIGEIHPPRSSKYVLPPFLQDRPISYCQAIQRSLTAPMVNTEPETIEVNSHFNMNHLLNKSQNTNDAIATSNYIGCNINKTKITSQCTFLQIWTYLEV